ITLGELGLRDKKPKEAVDSFTIAKATEDSARTRGGLMRAYDANGDFDKAKKEAVDLATKFPKHVPSRLLLARYAWDQGKDEKEATRWLDELKKPELASGASPAELIDASTLRGNLLLERGRVTDARTAYDQAVAASQGAPAPFAQLGLGEVDMIAGQYPSAIAHFNAAAQAMPELTQAKIGVARAKLKQELPGEAKMVLAPLKDPRFAGEIGFWLGQTEEKLAPDKPTEAMKIYEGSIKAQPSEVKSYIALAKLQAKVGRPEEAEITLANAIKAVPPSDKLHLAVGQLKFSQSKYDAALTEFDAALELQPDNLEALFDKARTLLRIGPTRMEEGKKVLDEVEKKDPKYPNLALEFGYFYLHTNQVAEALKRYQAALDAAPNDIDVKLNVGIAMVESHNPDAEQTLQDVLDKCSTNSSSPDFCITESRHYKGRALLDKGSNGDALTYLKQAVEKGDSNASYHLYYGWALVRAERYPEGEIEINRTLELDKSKAEAYWLRGEILSRRAQYKEAIAQANEALRQQPTISAAHATIGFCLMKLNQENEAIAELRKGIEGDPTNPQSAWWRYLVADIASHQNATAKARKEIKEAVTMVATKDPAPPWLPKAYFYLGEASRYTDKEEAKKAYRTWLEKSVGNTDPARGEAKAALVELGQPYGGL
ncbi:MAG: tetratricopeptide repeat protein, partial [Polyangiales bacterium]